MPYDNTQIKFPRNNHALVHDWYYDRISNFNVLLNNYDFETAKKNWIPSEIKHIQQTYSLLDFRDKKDMQDLYGFIINGYEHAKSKESFNMFAQEVKTLMEKNRQIPLPRFLFKDTIQPAHLTISAKNIAKCFASDKNTNHSTQMRKFYNEVVKLTEKSNQQGFESVKNFVHMLPAKSAYACGRGHVSYTFEQFITKCVTNTKCNQSLQNFKYLFECVLGFYKEYRK